MRPKVLTICRAIREAGGRAMLVGGSVRDRLFEIASKDIDLEVFGLDAESLYRLLTRFGRVNTVGEHFSVYKVVLYGRSENGGDLDSEIDEADRSERKSRAAAGKQTERSSDDSGGPRFEIDVSIPRRESKSGRGHRGFVIEGDPGMTFEAAARRRDFTINAILLDPLTDDLVDPFGGVQDIKDRVLRAVAKETFVEDSLRVLRAAQLAARFELSVEPETAELCRSMDLSDLPRERVWGEMEKLLTLARKPSTGLAVAFDLLIVDKLFPEAHCHPRSDEAASGTASRGPVEVTGQALDCAANLTINVPREKRIAVMLAALCHRLGGQPSDQSPSKGDSDTVQFTRTVLDRLGVHSVSGFDLRPAVLALVKEQRTPLRLYSERERTTDGDIRRAALRVDIGLLYLMATARAGGSNDDEERAAADWFVEKARSLGVEKGPLPPILRGRDLIREGYEPGRRMGEILRLVYELQLDGQVTTLEEALAAARRQ